MSAPDDRRLEELLRGALDAEARRVQISGDGLDRIRARTAGRRFSWWLPVLAGAAAIAVVIAVVWGTGALDHTPTPPVHTATQTPSPTTSPTSPAPSETPTDTTPTVGPGATRTLPVYFVGQQFNGPEADPPPTFVLFREYHELVVDGDDGATGSPADATRALWVRTALTAMFANTPLDEDYIHGQWPATAQVTDVAYDGASGRVTVDLTGVTDLLTAAPPDGVEAADVAQITLQQLVFTATGASVADGTGSATFVDVTVDGAPLTQLFGSPVTMPATRSASATALIWILSPVEGATVSVPVEVSGVANVFEAQGQWRLTDATGAEVDSGTFSTASSGTSQPFTIDLGTLAPGQYMIEVYDLGGLGMPGRGPSDTKNFTVS